MPNPLDIVQQINNLLINELGKKDPNINISVKRTSLGWIHLEIVTNLFQGKTPIEREAKIDGILSELSLNLGSYPFINYSLLSVEENFLQVKHDINQLPLWSEILMAPELNTAVPLDQEDTNKAFIVTFYSFKGGVGRSTALGLVANILASRGHRVVMVDLDLEAPGLSFMFPLIPSGGNELGVLDYIHQRYLTPDKDNPSIRDLRK